MRSRGRWQLYDFRLVLWNGLIALPPMPGLMLAPGQYCGEHGEGQDNGADNQNRRKWHIPLRLLFVTS